MMNREYYNVFGDDFDRFDFPCEVIRVTAGHGGEALLIAGGEKNALIDCGMAYCGKETADNLAKAADRLDYILLSHSHYDHIGGLPYIRDRFPEALVCGSERCAKIVKKPNARRLMERLGHEAGELYAPESCAVIRTDGLQVDLILRDGDSIELGGETVTALETKGHTDCSLSYYLEPVGLLFTSESTGILEGKDYVHTPILKSFSDALRSAEKCRSLAPEFLCLPHFGMLPPEYNDIFFDKFEEECGNKIEFVRKMIAGGLSEEEMFERYTDRYWTPAKEAEQPYKAFAINAGHILKALMREINGDENV